MLVELDRWVKDLVYSRTWEVQFFRIEEIRWLAKL